MLQAASEEAVYLHHGHEHQLASIVARAASCRVPGDLTPSQVPGVFPLVSTLINALAMFVINIK